MDVATRFADRLGKGLLVTDGAMGTMLQAAGLSSGECPELWNVARPERIVAVHRGYVEAGAGLVLTNTFGGSRLKLAKYGLGSRVAELNRAGIGLARSVGTLVGASIGPTGAILEPVGDASPSEVSEAFAEQIEACRAADAIWIESMSDLQEARLAAEAARRVADLPVVVTFTFEQGARGLRTMMGVSPTDLAQEFSDADVLGVNCTTVEACLTAVEELRSQTSQPLVARPNAGIPRWERGRTIFPTTAAQFAEEARPLSERVAILGGCCGTTPEHIRAIASALKTA